MSTPLQTNQLDSYNFRDELKAQFEQRKKVNERYSLRAFAHFLDIDAPTLQKIMTGKRALGKKSILNLGTRLKIDATILEKYVEAHSLRRQLGTSLKNDSIRSSYTLLGEDMADLVQQWSSYGILELLSIKDFKLSTENVVKALKIPFDMADNLIQQMKEKNWIKQTETQDWISNIGQTRTDPNSEVIEKARITLMSSIIEKSLHACKTLPRTHRSHYARTVAIDRNLLPAYIEKMGSFLFELEKWLIDNSRGKANEVYQLQVGLYPLSHYYDEKTF